MSLPSGQVDLRQNTSKLLAIIKMLMIAHQYTPVTPGASTQIAIVLHQLIKQRITMTLKLVNRYRLLNKLCKKLFDGSS